MEAYFRGVIPNLAQLHNMAPALSQMYSQIAAHKFFFFCASHRQGLFRCIIVHINLQTLHDLWWT